MIELGDFDFSFPSFFFGFGLCPHVSSNILVLYLYRINILLRGRVYFLPLPQGIDSLHLSPLSIFAASSAQGFDFDSLCSQKIYFFCYINIKKTKKKLCFPYSISMDAFSSLLLAVVFLCSCCTHLTSHNEWFRFTSLFFLFPLLSTSPQFFSINTHFPSHTFSYIFNHCVFCDIWKHYQKSQQSL